MTPQLSLNLPVVEPSQMGDARRRAVQLAEEAGFTPTAQANVALAINELASNLLKHGRDGQLIVCTRHREFEVLSIDRGPGIRDVEKCLKDGFSTAGSPGTGLGAVRRLAAFWDIHSQPDVGTVLLVRLTDDVQPVRPTPAVQVRGVSIPARGESVCGDAWLDIAADDACRIMVVDGLGHGPEACTAAHEAIRVLGNGSNGSPSELLHAAHGALRATRGGAVAAAELRVSAGTMRFAGVGNIAGFILADGKTQNLVSMNGTVGCQTLKIREFDYALPRGAVVVLYSDGLNSRVRFDGYPGLSAHDPSVIAGVLYRDFQRGRDDATVVVASVA